MQPQQQTVVTTATVLPQPQARRMNMKTSAILGLGITQIVIGAIVFFFGIAVVATLYNYWVNHSGTAIVAGIWLIITGAIGISSAKNPLNGCLNGTNMAFNIIACVGAFLDASFFGAAIGHYNECKKYRYHYSYSYSYYHVSPTICYDERNTARGLYGFLLFSMVVEFFIALAISILCCQANGCCSGNSSNGVVIQNSQPAVVYQGGGGMVHITTTYPAQPYAQPYNQQAPVYQTGKSPYPPPSYQQQPQYNQQPQHPQQSQYPYQAPQQQQPMVDPNPPVVTYDNGSMPPAYNP